MPKDKNEPVSLTESELKAEALRKREEQAKLDALKKPPSPRKAKADNYWYHYKWHTIGGIAALVLLVFFVRDVLLRTDPDATIVLMTSRYLSPETIDSLQTALEETAGDWNGDGKVSIVIDPIQIDASVLSPDDAVDESAPPDAPPMNGGGEIEYANLMKMNAVVAANSDPLFLLDDAMYDYLLRISAGDDGVTQSMFAPLPEELAADGDRLPVNETVLAHTPGLEGLDGLTFSIRVNRKDDDAYHDYCMELLREVAAR